MPSRNAIKQYASNSYYHIYNRGVEKRIIFIDEQDYNVFLSYFKVALSPELAEETKKEALTEIEEHRLRRLRLSDELDLLAYCLMPNHFHLLVYQKHEPQAISKLMRSTMSGYVRYFNKKYDRVGSLFQGTYKASLIDNEAYLWHISRYIHCSNPKQWQNYPYSSYKYYLKEVNASWVKPKTMTDMHGGPDRYRIFMNDYADYKNSLKEFDDQLAD